MKRIEVKSPDKHTQFELGFISYQSASRVYVVFLLRGRSHGTTENLATNHASWLGDGASGNAAQSKRYLSLDEAFI